jgi:hypothetical protein
MVARQATAAPPDFGRPRRTATAPLSTLRTSPQLPHLAMSASRPTLHTGQITVSFWLQTSQRTTPDV